MSSIMWQMAPSISLLREDVAGPARNSALAKIEDTFL
jgi:hypothetical protein